MAATLLGIYNAALRHLGERRLTATTETRDVRYHLDDAYADVKPRCLEAGLWNFAMRASQQDSSSSVEPTFGLNFAFQKPSDWVRTYIVSPNEWLREWVIPLTDEAGYWYSNIDPMWAKWVSSSTSYGYDLSRWPQSYIDYVGAELAATVAATISSTSAEKLASIREIAKRFKSNALAKDATGEPPMFFPQNSWSLSRGRGWGTRGGGTAMPGGRIF